MTRVEMEHITNDTIVKFLTSRIELIQSGTYTLDEFMPILSFYLEHLPNSDNAFEHSAFRNNALLGWYITQNFKQKTS